MKRSAGETNAYYTEVKPRFERFSHSRALRAASAAAGSRVERTVLGLAWAGTRLRETAPWLLVPFLLPAAAGVWAAARLLRTASGPMSPWHQRALDLVDDFLEQYPLNPYMCLAKSVHLAFLRDALGNATGPIVEVGAGEGSFSARVFPRRASVIAIDINPVSLSKAASRPYVSRAVVADGMHPPVRPASLQWLVANNLLMHVGAKAPTLERWAQSAERIAFNACTPTFVEALPVPAILRALGWRRAAGKVSDAICNVGAVHLEPALDLDALAARAGGIEARASYLSGRATFLCGVMSALMLYQGPTPLEVHRVLVSWPLRALTRRLTRALARAVIELDAAEDRSSDAYIVYVVSTGTIAANADGVLACARCRGVLGGDDRCQTCGHRFATHGGMLFDVPARLAHVEAGYDPGVAAGAPLDHL